MGMGGRNDGNVSARSLSSPDAGQHILEHQAAGRIEAQPLCPKPIASGIGLAYLHVLCCHDLQRLRQAGSADAGAGEG